MNALNKPGFLQNNKTFQTIYGRNLLHELNIIIPEETLIVTMEDLWGNFSNFFTKPEPEPEAQNLLSSTFRSDFLSDRSTTGSNNLIIFFMIIIL